MRQPARRRAAATENGLVQTRLKPNAAAALLGTDLGRRLQELDRNQSYRAREQCGVQRRYPLVIDKGSVGAVRIELSDDQRRVGPEEIDAIGCPEYRLAVRSEQH